MREKDLLAFAPCEEVGSYCYRDAEKGKIERRKQERANAQMKCTFSLLRLAYSALALTLAPVAGVGAGPGYPAFAIRETAWTLHAEATARRFIAAHGRRGMIVGYAGESLEGWVYPFRIFHDYRIGFRLQGSTGVIPGTTTAHEVIVNPRIGNARLFGPELHGAGDALRPAR